MYNGWYAGCQAYCARIIIYAHTVPYVYNIFKLRISARWQIDCISMYLSHASLMSN